MTLHESTYKAFRFVKSEIIRRGTSSLPPELRALVRGSTELTNGQVIELAFAALKMRMEKNR